MCFITLSTLSIIFRKSRRGKNIVDQLEAKPSSDWKKIRVMKADGKGRILKVVDEILDKSKDYNKQIRQVAITGHGKIKPCLIITNDFQIKIEDLIRKYTRRWIVEKVRGLSNPMAGKQKNTF